MEKQYCRVGSSTPMAQLNQPSHFLESLYNDFKDRAMSPNQGTTNLGSFFEQKAERIQKMIQELA
jgi:hypothetical protein